MSQEELFVNGDLLRLSREARGWVLNDMATRACMSVKQIRQLEEGGTSAFYSAAVKATAAKKVAALLGLSVDAVFAQTVKPMLDTSLDGLEVVSAKILGSQVDVNDSEQAPLVEPSAVTQFQTLAPSEGVQSETIDSASNAEATAKSKTSLLTIAALFAAALGAAAYLQPKEELVGESAPPVQVLPADVTDPASAASASDASASVADAQAAASVSVAAVKSVSSASVVAPVASATRLVSSQPVVASSTAAPSPSSAASKAP